MSYERDSDGGVEIGSFQLTGIKAVIAIVAVVGFGGWYWWNGTQPKPAPPEVYEPIKMWVSNDYNARALENVTASNGLGMNDKELARANLAMRQVVMPDDVTLKNAQIRGDHEDKAVVRTEIEIKGGPAPDGKTVRYYEVEWITLSREWRVRYEVDEFNWKTAAW